ncbi:hypothetical protein MNEG_3780 [Monoraphidium neglectum]|uniref:Histone RNA hairpin-binding protein RNA-binding domain-containing protein n=1 Tax=Monoraphidium neglectum TaxID=145388 RepID=A0A0D2NGQ3_9CHLO|nr:hypothetical protein MNEG_3780 [Monoraphidium neglectum]KIZ04176.1 hypothetical protein MNEG_3780 [Monoraphidium neglectum]|eukprot:XP_013903195.1 hypothetical protein MNEG_3780 [Monoraphidium neglectum]
MDHTEQFLLDFEAEEDLDAEAALEAEMGEEGGIETDPARLAQRQKQITFGKNSQAYQNYIKAVPRHTRKLRGKGAHPSTPDITLKASKRCWAGIVSRGRFGTSI